MTRPKLRTRTFSYNIIIFLVMTTRLVKSDYLPSCTYNCAPFIPGAVAYWPMTFNTKSLDISGYKNHAKFVNLTYTGGPNGETQGAVHFNGSNNSFAMVKNSPSMNIGKYPGFTFTGHIRYLGLQNESASLIDWSGNNGYGVFIVASKLIIQLHLHPNHHNVITHKAEFLNHKLANGTWHFIGMSYDKATGRATVFKDGQLEVKQLDKNIAAGSDKTSEVGLGIDLSSDMEFNYKGDMSCMMLFQYALTADDFKRVMEFCRTTKSTQTMLPNITVSDIAKTYATASWTKSPGIFTKYNIAIERKRGELSMESVHPMFISSFDTILQSALSKLIPGETYRVCVWHMQGELKGRARYSAWFATIIDSSPLADPPIFKIIAVIALILAAICLVALVVVIVLIVNLKRERRNQGNNDDHDPRGKDISSGDLASTGNKVGDTPMAYTPMLEGTNTDGNVYPRQGFPVEHAGPQLTANPCWNRGATFPLTSYRHAGYPKIINAFPEHRRLAGSEINDINEPYWTNIPTDAATKRETNVEKNPHGAYTPVEETDTDTDDENNV